MKKLSCLLSQVLLLGCFLSASAREVVITSLCSRTSQVQAALMEKMKERRQHCSHVSVEDLRAVTFLNLNNKGITSLKVGDFSGLFSLEVLNLKGNQLRNLPVGVFSELSSLDTLDLGGNQLSRLVDEGVFSSLSSLKRLSLYNNQLKSLSSGVFFGMFSLNLLILGKNQLKSLPRGLFSGSPFLKDIILNYNQLSDLPPNLFSELSLQRLDLSGNPLSVEAQDRIRKKVKAQQVVF